MRYLTIGFFLLLASCWQNNSVSDTKADTSKKINKVQQVTMYYAVLTKDTTTKLHLNYGFEISDGLTRTHTGTSTFFELRHNGKRVFVDTINNFEFEKQPPILNKLRTGAFELLVEFDNNPNKNLTLVLRIEQDKIIKRDTVATFIGKQEKINGMVVRSGAWDNSEEWDENGVSYITFDPVIYYKFTSAGVGVDSALTRERTKAKYGNVDPFDHTHQIGFPIDSQNKIDTISKHVYRKKIAL